MLLFAEVSQECAPLLTGLSQVDWQRAKLCYISAAHRPAKMWINLFDFFGFGVVAIPPHVHKAVAERGDFVAYNRSNPTLRRCLEEDFAAPADSGRTCGPQPV